MTRRVFVSYSHRQGEWVWDRLVPVLKAGGADVRIDRERFAAGKAVIGQMDAVQDDAEMTILVLSPEYLNSPYCAHEMDRAVGSDPAFATGRVVPLVRAACGLPAPVAAAQPLVVSLEDDADSLQWDKLTQACGADLGADAPVWLNARNEARRSLERPQSVNLLVSGNPCWRPLIEELRRGVKGGMGIVDLEKGSTVARHGLLAEMLAALTGVAAKVPAEPEDLAEFDRALAARRRSYLAIKHFDLVSRRPQYGGDLFSALRYHLMETRQLVLLVHSRTPFAALLPADHPLSAIDIKTVELPGRP